jgi:glycosyltransferase involved in cell wall biosynthesis
VISFIVPAHNEQAVLGRTLRAIHDSARIVSQPYEIIVVDDASTDATAEIARRHQTTVVRVNHRQIAATRNSGGRAARGDRLFFVDADTTINPRAVAAALRYIDKGAVGGGGTVLFDGPVPLYVRLVARWGVIAAKLGSFTGGAFMFCTREAFRATGGFDERFYWAEEGVFALALKRQGRFIVVWTPVLTSPRRLRTLSGWHFLVFMARTLLFPLKAFTQRSSVEKIWYDSNRENDHKIPNSPGVHVFNGIILLILIVLFTGPAWYFIPSSLTPWNSPLGKFRFVTGIFLCHAGLIFWPFAIIVCVHLFRRRQWIEWMKLAALGAFCSWQAWRSTLGVIWFWTWFYRRLAHFQAPVYAQRRVMWTISAGALMRMGNMLPTPLDTIIWLRPCV